MVREINPIENLGCCSASLPLFENSAPVMKTRCHRHAKEFLKIILLNRYIREILDRLPELGVKSWITSGCLVQTVWNVKTGKRPFMGIDDYDLIYFDSDLSWKSEDAVIRRGEALFEDLKIDIQIRNQARVPIWYHDKFGIRYPPVREAPYAVRRYPSRSTAIAATRERFGQISFYAPFGFSDALRMKVRPNKRLAIASVYQSKARRWQTVWPQLVVQPWDAADSER